MKSTIAAIAALLAVSTAPAVAAPSSAGDPLFRLEPTPACATAFRDDGKPHEWADPLDEEARASLSAMIFLTLRRAEAASPPRPEGACAVAHFTAGDVLWSMHAGQAGEPVRWISAPARESWFYLTTSAAPADAATWARTRSGLPVATQPLAFMLVGVTADRQYVVQTYDGPPSPQLMAEDLASLIDGGAPPLGSFLQVGDVANIYRATRSGLMSDIYSLSEISRGNLASLDGPDGRFFSSDIAKRLVILRGSGLHCPERLNTFRRTELFIANSTEEHLDLGCAYGTERSSITVYSTRSADAAGDKRLFQRVISGYQRDTGVSSRLSDPPTGPAHIAQAGKQWIDKEGLVQMILFLRRSDHVIEFRVTHTVDETREAGDAILPLLDQISPGRE